MADFELEPPVSSDVPGSNNRYPALPPIPSLLGFSLGFSEAGRRAFTDFHLIACREYNFYPNPLEKEALSYYNGTFYGAEALGARNGVLGGGAIGLIVAMRSKNPWRIFRFIGNRINMNKRYQHAFSRGVTLFMFTQLGKFYGATSAGVAAFGQITAQQKKDPNMQRYLTLRKKWVESHGPMAVSEYGNLKRKFEAEKEAGHLPSQTDSSNVPDDDQSLGGMDYYDIQDDKRQQEAQAAPAAPARRQWKRPVEQAKTTDDDDPFLLGSAADNDESTQEQAPTGSAWERLRRGERPATERRSQREAPEETYGWGDAGQEKESARERAQREFNERLDRERHGENVDGFVGESEQTRGSGGYRK